MAGIDHPVLERTRIGDDFRWVPGYEGVYAAAPTGAIFSVSRHSAKGGLLTPYKAKHGYLVVSLCKDGKQKVSYVHRIIAATFLGDPPPGMQVRHLDGCRDNPELSNLAYGTASDNEQDKIRHGTYHIGEKHPSAKLTDKDVSEIKSLISKGVGCMELSKRFNISPPNICNIKYGHTWSHIDAS